MDKTLSALRARMNPLTALLGLAALAGLAACAGGSQGPRPHHTMNLDSLHVIAVRNDSVEANLPFYDSAYEQYRVRFPGVDRPAFMKVAVGKDPEFCLFRPDPGRICLEIAEKFQSLDLGEPARDALIGGLVSEGYNPEKINIRLWAAMAKSHFDAKEFVQGKAYLVRVLEVEPGNRWAKRLMASANAPANRKR